MLHCATGTRSYWPRTTRARLARRYAELLAAGSGLDAQEVWEWGYLERVSTGLYVLAFGSRSTCARPFFRTAELLLDA